jgi:hypothetical protein
VTSLERDAALDRITRRHQDDYRWSEAGTEARDVLSYLRRRHVTLPWSIAAHDVWDELVLSSWVYWDERRRERELLARARTYGLSLSEIGRFIGIGTRQGMRDYLDRLEALLHESAQHTGPPSESGVDHSGTAGADRDGPPLPLGINTTFVGRSRADRDADVHAHRRARAQTRARPSQQDWLRLHASRVEAVLRDLLTQATRLGIDAEESDAGEAATLGDYLTWLAEDLEEGLAPDTLGTLGLALGELRHHATLTTLARNHGMYQAIGAADRLRADYADLTTT